MINPLQIPATRIELGATVVALIDLLALVDDCHGCLWSSDNWPEHHDALELAADRLGMGEDGRWWRRRGRDG